MTRWSPRYRTSCYGPGRTMGDYPCGGVPSALLAWRSGADRLVFQVRHVLCPLNVSEGPPCQGAHIPYEVRCFGQVLAGCGHIPQPHGEIGAAAGQGLAVRAERHRGNRAAVAGEGAADLVAGACVPQMDGAVGVAGGQGLAVRAERDRVNWADLAVGGVPELELVAGSHVP